MATSLLNVNIGLLGHVDSGKTSLARALSDVFSTCALDKHPQSAARGITLDLGFSSFVAPLPDHLAGSTAYGGLRFTLVDCPGHASLIRTVIGGAAIMDAAILVIDVTKGMQTQTAECLVIAELTLPSDACLVLALNKADLLPAEGRDTALAKLQRRLAATLSTTRFAGAQQVVVSARPGGGEGFAPGGPQAEGTQELVQALLLCARERTGDTRRELPLLVAFDHCFAVRGSGTILTGTVLQGRIAVGQLVEVPAIARAKVKSLQAFRVPVQAAGPGDRVGICFPGLDSSRLERGILCEPGSVPIFTTAVARVQRVRFYKHALSSGVRLHVSIGHDTRMAELRFFAAPQGPLDTHPVQHLPPAVGVAVPASACALSAALWDDAADFEHVDELGPGDQQPLWALLRFDGPVTCPHGALLLASRLDLEGTNTCRLALHGRLAAVIPEGGLSRLRVFKRKQREGTVERWADSRTAIVRGLFKKETDMTPFEGMRVECCGGHAGVLQGAFGKSGKVKVVFSSPLFEPEQDAAASPAYAVYLSYKKFVYAHTKKLTQCPMGTRGWGGVGCAG